MKRTIKHVLLAGLILMPAVSQAQSAWLSQFLGDKKVTINPVVACVATGLVLTGIGYKLMKYIYRPRMLLVDCPSYQNYLKALAQWEGFPAAEYFKNKEAVYCDICGHTHKDDKARKTINEEALSHIKNKK